MGDRELGALDRGEDSVAGQRLMRAGVESV